MAETDERSQPTVGTLVYNGLILNSDGIVSFYRYVKPSFRKRIP